MANIKSLPTTIKIGDIVLFEFKSNKKFSIGTIDSFTDYPSMPYRVFRHDTQTYVMLSTEQIIIMKDKMKNFKNKFRLVKE